MHVIFNVNQRVLTTNRRVVSGGCRIMNTASRRASAIVRQIIGGQEIRGTAQGAGQMNSNKHL